MNESENDQEYDPNELKIKYQKEAYLKLKDLTNAFNQTYKKICKNKELTKHPLKYFSKEEISDIIRK